MLAQANDAELAVLYPLMVGGHAVFALPPGVVVRQRISHLGHHHGQITVWLRRRDVPAGRSARDPAIARSAPGENRYEAIGRTGILRIASRIDSNLHNAPSRRLGWVWPVPIRDPPG